MGVQKREKFSLTAQKKQTFFSASGSPDTDPPDFVKVSNPLQDLENAVLFEGMHPLGQGLAVDDVAGGPFLDERFDIVGTREEFIDADPPPVAGTEAAVTADRAREQHFTVGDAEVTEVLRTEFFYDLGSFQVAWYILLTAALAE